MLLRVGVTGHRALDDPGAVARRVDGVLDRLARDAGTPATPASLHVWSSLAEGADRLVAERVLARAGSTLVAVLPLDLDDYRTDCGDAASAAHLDELVARAARVEVTGAGSTGDRTIAYERAGRRVVAGCDVLVALWDGRPAQGRGGTAEIVATARRCGRRLEVVTVARAGVNGRGVAG